MGTWTYGYNVLSELIWQKDAKLQTITMTYDELGRMITRVLPGTEGTGTWTYGIVVPEIGKLKTVSNPNATETYIYDYYGRVSSSGVSISGFTYTSTYAYDPNGRLDTIAYPSINTTTFVLKHVYDSFGYLKEVRKDTATGALYWQATEFDAHNRLTKETFGNNLLSARAYNHETADLVTITTGPTSNPTAVQNSSFTFDALDNLTARNWWSGTATRSETFGYDNLNRLTTVTGPANKTYAYYPNGNIQSKTGVGTYSYPTNGVRPHAVASTLLGTTTTSYGYDANGNMTTRAGRTITYSSFNKPISIGGASGTTALAYDANYNRVYKTAPGVTTTYVGKLYEKTVSGTTTTQKNYIYAGSNLVGAYSIVNGTPNTRYFHTDHLGSVEVITNETGGVVQRLSYDVFGKRRNVSGADATSITAQTTRGFTRHEHDDEVGLVNMNARQYDYVLGRFITADTIIPGATSSQAYNRYSYVNNNPLSGTDPTGHSRLSRAVRSIARASVGAAIVSASVPINLAPRKQTVANFTSHVLNKVGSVPYVGGLASVGLLTSQFGYAYGWSTGDWNSVGQAHKQGAIMAGTAYAFGYVGDLYGGAAGNAFGHGIVGGTSSVLSGGDFRSGFVSAGFGSLASGLGCGGFVCSTLAGGAGSRLAGGSFVDGAVMAGIGWKFNHDAHNAHQHVSRMVDGNMYDVSQFNCATAACVMYGANYDSSYIGTQEYFRALNLKAMGDASTLASAVTLLSPLSAAGRMAGYAALSTDMASFMLFQDHSAAASAMVGASTEISARGFGVPVGPAARIGAGSSLIFDYLNNR